MVEEFARAAGTSPQTDVSESEAVAYLLRNRNRKLDDAWQAATHLPAGASYSFVVPEYGLWGLRQTETEWISCEILSKSGHVRLAQW
jgi:hypothetical protein